jgi:hypothetical protein
MVASTPTMSAIDRVVSRLPDARKVGCEWLARCPVHEDRSPSLSVTIGSKGEALMICRAGCRTEDVVAALGLTMSDLFEPREADRRIVATYDYRDEAGQLLYQVCRYEPKDFRARRPNGAGWTWTLDGTRRVPYRLPELRLTKPGALVLIVEGEKDADRLAGLGLNATTNLGGAGKWRAGYNEPLAGRDVVILPDNDDPGRRHTQGLAASLAGLASRVRIIELPNLPPKGDVSDWLDAGGSRDDLLGLIEGEGIEAPASSQPPDVPARAETGEQERRSQAARLVDLAEDAELFHTPTGEPFVTLVVAEHRETHAVRSKAFGGWLRERYWHAFHQPPTATAMGDAVETLAARAEFGADVHPVAVRVAEHAGRLYVDLANDAWQVVEIGPGGWGVIDSQPVRFQRPATMEPLPDPVRGGTLDLLRPFVNVADDDAWHLFAGYLVAAFRPSGPYLVLVLHGEQGSAKSTTAKLVRLVVDPARSPLRAEPRDQQDLLIAARNNWIVAFDNISHLSPWLSDAMCRLSTGGGLGKRQLYTDLEEIVLDAQRPQILNGITEFVSRGDLLDRAIIQEQPTIRDAARRSEGDFWRAFNAVRPSILGALLDAVTSAFTYEPGVKLDELPRMADPTRWVTAAEPALGWPAGTFAAAFRRNRRDSSAITLDAALITAPLRELAATGEWRGTATELLRRLAELAGEETSSQREWPTNAKALTDALKRLAPDLRAIGIEWRRLARTGSTRLHLIRRIGGGTVTAVTTDTTSTSRSDSPASTAFPDRHFAERSVTPSRAWSDARDGDDGHAPGLDDDLAPRPVAMEGQPYVIPAAFEDLVWMPGPA